MKRSPPIARLLPVFLALAAAPAGARTDVVSAWNAAAADLAAAGKLSPPAAYRAMALVQTAVLEAVEAEPDEGGAAQAAAVAAASRIVLLHTVPVQAQAIEREHARSLAALPQGPEARRGLATGERVAKGLLARRAADEAAAGQEAYRPATAPGVWVPTTLPAASSWPQRVPWVLERPSALRPAPPPALDSAAWERDLLEVQELGVRDGSARTEEQTAIARFWEATMPAIYFSVVRGVAQGPGRSVLGNARLYAAAAQAMDDALIATFDAKFHHGFWRPITAIRNADLDGSAATERDPSWLPLIDTPMHPEFPAAHASLAGALAAVLRAELGAGAVLLTAASPTAPGMERSWTSVDAFVAEVAEARVWAGVHFRTSTAVGSDLGRQVGERVAARLLVPRR